VDEEQLIRPRRLAHALEDGVVVLGSLLARRDRGGELGFELCLLRGRKLDVAGVELADGRAFLDEDVL